MASIMICDRCSRLGKGAALGAIALRTSLASRDRDAVQSYEMCPACVAAFIEWVAEGKDTGASAPPFTEPYDAERASANGSAATSAATKVLDA